MKPGPTMQEFFRTIEGLAQAPRRDAMLEVLIRRLGVILGAAHCACLGVSEDRRHARIIAMDGNPELRDVAVDVFRYPEAVEAAVTGRTVYAPEVLRDRLFLTHLAQWPDAPEAHEIESVAAIPLLSHHATCAVVVVRTRRGEPALTPERVELLEQLVRATATLLLREDRLAVAACPQSAAVGLDALDRRLREELERVRRYGSQLSFALLDCSALTQIPGSGDGGDRLLTEIDALLRQEVRAPDFVARYHGPVFALLMPSTSLVEARLLLLRISASLAGAPRDARRGPLFAAGLVSFPDVGISRVEDLLAGAEAALIRGRTDAGDGVGMLGNAA